MKPLKEYSVLLRYPDYVSDTGETFYAFVTASNPKQAVALAQQDACELNNLTERDDFAPILVTAGHNKGLNYES